ncbi:MAG: hypothetical protein AAF721_01345 [Myxococcota bacterium]
MVAASCGASPEPATEVLNAPSQVAPTPPGEPVQTPTTVREPPRVETAAAPKPVGGVRFVSVLEEEPDQEETLHAARRIFETVDGSLFITAGPQVMRVRDDGSFERDASWLGGLRQVHDIMYAEGPGLLRDWSASFLGGRWPDATFFVLDARFGSRGMDESGDVHRWSTGRWRWTASSAKHYTWTPHKAAAWKDNSVLMLRRLRPKYESYFDPDDETSHASESEIAADLAALARAKRLVVARGTLKAPAAIARRPVLAFDAAEDGTIVAATGGDEPVVAHIAPDGKVIDRSLPDSEHLFPDDIVLLADGSAWLWGRRTGGDVHAPYLARFDGKAWQLAEAPPCESQIGSMSITPSGTQWAVCGATLERLHGSELYEDPTLWSRAVGGTWVAHELPDDGVPLQVIARDDDDVWVSGSSVYRSSNEDLPSVALPALYALWLESWQWRDPVDDAGWCSRMIVPVTTPLDDDYADIVAALNRALASDGEDYYGKAVLRIAPFRDEPRLVLQVIGDVPVKTARRIRKALGKRFGGAHCAAFRNEAEASETIAEFSLG